MVSKVNSFQQCNWTKMGFGAREELVNWAVTYDWANDPVGMYNRPQDLAEVWPLVRIHYMMRFGPHAHNLNHLIGFLEFLQKRESTESESVFSPATMKASLPEIDNGDSKPNTVVVEDNRARVELTSKDKEDTNMQNLRARTQFLFGKSPEYFLMEGEEDDGFHQPGVKIIKVTIGNLNATGRGKRIGNAIQAASFRLLVKLKDLTPNLPEILNNIEFSNIDKFILNQKILLEKEIEASLGLCKKATKQADDEDEVLQVAEMATPIYGGSLVTLWSTGTLAADTDVRAGSNVALKGKDAEMFGIVVSVDEAQVVLSVKENQLIFSLETEFFLERLEGTREFQKLMTAVENAKKPRRHWKDLRDVLFGLKEPEVDLSIATPSFCNENLDKTQKKVVEFVLRQKELAIIHGPPGTGKTTTVVEVIIQTINSGGKVLVCAPSNVAVDNIHERLIEFMGGEGGRFLRIGQPPRISEALHPFTLDAIIQGKTAEVEIIRGRVAHTQAALDQGIDGVTQERLELRKEMEDLKQELRKAVEVLEKSKEVAVRNADVVLGTLTTCTPEGPLALLPKNHFALTVIDECGQALEAACWLVVPRAPRLLLAGDHLQLPPTIHSRNKDVRKHLSETMMERLVDRYGVWGNKVAIMLDVQYRMNQKIMRWSSDVFYFSKLYASPTVANHTLAGLPNVSPIHGLTDTVLLLVDTADSDMPEVSPGDSNSFANVGEAQVACHIVRLLMGSGLKPEQLGVITTYAKQVELLERNLQKDYNGLEIKSVDGFQGREKEVIVLSLVRSNKSKSIGFLVENRRLNVAVTRARRQLIVICDSSTVSGDPFIKKLIDYLNKNGSKISPKHKLLDSIKVPEMFKVKPKSCKTTKG